MDNEQTELTTQNHAGESAHEPVKEEVQPIEKEEEWKAPASKEDYERALKSASSKGKYDLLKELGISSVDDFKSKQNTYDEAIKSRDELNKKIEELSQSTSQLNDKLLISETGVMDDYKEDFLTLVKSKAATTGKDYNEVAADILLKNPTWKKGNDSVQIGTEKSEIKEVSLESKLNKKFPWIHD